MIKIVNTKVGYEIKDLKFQLEKEIYLFNWRYQKGSHFLLIVSNARERVTLDKGMALRIWEKWEILEKKGSIAFDDFWAIWLQEPVFSNGGKKYEIRKNDISRFLPAQIQIFPCEMDGEDVIVYRVAEKGSSTVLPVYINVKIQYKKIWFSRKKRCIFKTDQVKNYEEGMLYYYVMEDSSRFPLTVQSLGKRMEVIMLRNGQLNIKLADKYESFYEIKEKMG